MPAGRSSYRSAQASYQLDMATPTLRPTAAALGGASTPGCSSTRAVSDSSSASRRWHPTRLSRHSCMNSVSDEPGLTERKMFGGLAFLFGRNMAVAASGQGGLLATDLSRISRARRPAGAGLLGWSAWERPCSSVVAHGLEVVRGCVIRNAGSELDRLQIGCAEVESRPDTGLDDLVDCLRQAAERPRCRPARVQEGARDLIPAGGCVAEEHPQHGGVRAVETEVPG